jgi:hypothetical protein
MKIYEKQNNSGEAWFRGSNNKKLAGNIALSAFGEKYSNISQTIYSDITANNIKKLDVIQDVIILETPSGFFIDRFEISEGIPIPNGNYNNSITYSDSYSMDYWFDEINKKVYTVYGGISSFSNNINNKFVYDIYEFLISENIYKKMVSLYFDLSCAIIDNLDPLKLCYNQDTRIFNISTVFRISGVNEVNLFSANMKNFDNISIDSLKVVIPNSGYPLNVFQNILLVG